MIIIFWLAGVIPEHVYCRVTAAQVGTQASAAHTFSEPFNNFFLR